MRQWEQVKQIRVLIERLDAGENVDAGGLRLNPTHVYVDRDLAAREQQHFFTELPQLVGLSGDLPEPGSFLTLDDLATPILATRTPDGTFRAFVNACRHRGVVLAAEGRGTAARFVCPFHAWTYDGEGVLVGMPKRDHFGNPDASKLGLVELPALEQHGLLWVHPQPGGVIDTREMLGAELLDELESWNLDTLHHLGDDEYEVECNWKLAMDTFGETYHFASLHKDTLINAFHGNVQCYDTFGRNHRMLLCRRDIDHMRELPESEWQITTATLPVYWLFPNIVLMPSQTGLYLVRPFPDRDNPGRHVSRITFYLWPHIAANEELAEVSEMIAHGFAGVIRDEDYVVSASQQVSANSGAIEHAVFGRNEPALHHYHNTYRAMLGMDSLELVDAL